jgi:hypothetical protein
MCAAISAVIIAIATGITLFVQTVTLSACRRLECCCGKCEMGEVEQKKKTDDEDDDKDDLWLVR